MPFAVGPSASQTPTPWGNTLLPEPIPELNFEGEDAEEAQALDFTAGSIAVEFMHLPDAPTPNGSPGAHGTTGPATGQKQILERLIQADLFEQVIQSRYLGTKRFSLEGVTVADPFLG